MKRFAFTPVILAAASLATVHGATLYVSQSGRNLSPFTNWVNAATDIQTAIDFATAGDEILVTNGVYQSGGRRVSTSLTNRVAITKPVLVRSVGGPSVTTITGAWVPGSTNGAKAIRCVYVADGASLSGFTLTSGATLTSSWYGADYCGGGAYCQSLAALLTNCILSLNSAYSNGGGCYSGTLLNCTLSGNTAPNWYGGGIASATLSNCTLTGNAAYYGGGSANCNLYNCTLAANSATYAGGNSSAVPYPLVNCILTGNKAAVNGGGTQGGSLTSCIIRGNTAGTDGGGGLAAYLYGCLVTGNSAGFRGGGTLSCTLKSCTVVGNSAQYSGGTISSTHENCIVQFNSSSATTVNAQNTFNYCCTSPLPASGVGNIAFDPQFISYSTGNLRLQSNSPCINAGGSAVTAVDLDGRPRVVGGAVDMGAFEFQGPRMGEFINWLQQYGQIVDGSTDRADADGDGMTNWQEWRCGTNPTNAASVLRMLSSTVVGRDVMLAWQSVSGTPYIIERSTNQAAEAAFLPIATNVVGKTGTTSFTCTNSADAPTSFYRVGVPF